MAHRGAITVRHIERRFAIRVRIRIPPGGLGTRLDGLVRWLDRRLGVTGYQIWPDQHHPIEPQSTSIYLDDADAVPLMLREFGLELVADAALDVHPGGGRPSAPKPPWEN
ncbi:hypothetical protein STVA_41260 [Allostella vacuolata]|nr:hypothetical protein STVA_41260 [Stella vacuolata]